MRIRFGAGAALPCAIGLVAFSSIAVAHPDNVDPKALHAWHETMKNSPPNVQGCFHANYPSTVWEHEECLPEPEYRSNPPAWADGDSVAVDTVGNGYDYSAQTSNLTSSAAGSFPVETGVTSASNGDYTLQINTNFGPSPVCSSYGYGSCQTWEQFIYSSNYPGNAGTGVSGSQAFIQNWMFLSSTDYRKKKCPSGWNSYSLQHACYKNSLGVAAGKVALSGLSGVKLAGIASVNGLDTVTFTNGTTAKSVTQSGKTLEIGATWKQTEFNVVGNGGGSSATFNSGSSLTVNVAVTDGSTNAPTCVGPTNGGSTGETNNLNLGGCTATGGSSPYIQFTESN